MRKIWKRCMACFLSGVLTVGSMGTDVYAFAAEKEGKGTTVFADGGLGTATASDAAEAGKTATDSNAAFLKGKNAVFQLESLNGEGTENAPYEIGTAEELRGFAEAINASTDYGKGKYFVLTADINVTGEDWVPIEQFEGVLDGCFEDTNHTILYEITELPPKADSLKIGLFGQIKETGVVRNLRVEGNIGIKYDGYIQGCAIGGIVGNLYGTLKNCICNTNIDIRFENKQGSDYLFGSDMGGIVGRMYCGTMTDCIQEGTISVERIHESRIGGLVGIVIGTRQVERCGNEGDIIIGESLELERHYNSLGGVFGILAPSNESNIQVKNCFNAGTITHESGVDIYIGGITGCTGYEHEEDTGSVQVENCINFGTVTTESESETVLVGGICGEDQLNTCSDATHPTHSSTYTNVYSIEQDGIAIGAGVTAYMVTVEELATKEFAEKLNAGQTPPVWVNLSGDRPEINTDKTAPKLLDDVVVERNGSDVVLYLNLTESGSGYYAVSKDGTTPEIDMTGEGIPCGEGETELSIAGVTPEKQTLYLKIKDQVENVSELIKVEIPAAVYTIAYETNGGTIVGEAADEYTYGVGAVLPEKLERKGYEFGGWYGKADFSDAPQEAVSDTDTGDKRYYAKWLSEDVGVTSVSVNGTVGEKNGTQIHVTLAEGSALPDDSSAIEIVAASGASVSEITMEDDKGSRWSFLVTASSGKTQTYTIDISVNNIPPMLLEPVVVKRNGSEAVILLKPTETGSYYYVVAEGNQEPELDTEQDGIAYEKETVEILLENLKPEKQTVFMKLKDRAGNVSELLTAEIPAAVYSISYETNGGAIAGDAAREYTYGIGAALPDTVERAGYTFCGWYESKDFSGDSVNRIPETAVGNKSYYAKWKVHVPSDSESSSSPESNDSWKNTASAKQTGGQWRRNERGWWYEPSSGTWPAGCWKLLPYHGQKFWYRFDSEGYMQTGWFLDRDGKWYYLNPKSDGTMGRVVMGWHFISGSWYYFNQVSDGTYGALLVNTVTPDGYRVDADGKWVD